jgi:predicted metal-dependent hydrolase
VARVAAAPKAAPHHPDTIEVDGVPRPLVVKRTRRARRVRLRVDARRGDPVLVLPLRMALRDGRAFAESNAAWLRARLEELPPRTPFAPGAAIPILGVARVLVLDTAARAGVLLTENMILVGGQHDRFAHRLVAWLKRLARERIVARAAELAARIDRTPGRVGVRDQRARWGSCSRNGDLSFSWRLILAPPEVLDYVVTHEVAHLVHPHHGPRFWRLVERLMPGHETQRRWLDRHGAGLQRFG